MVQTSLQKFIFRLNPRSDLDQFQEIYEMRRFLAVAER